MSIIERYFLSHPATVGETYAEHMRTALSFAGPLGKASLAAFVHAFLPFLFVRTGSQAIAELNDRMLLKRRAHAPAVEHRLSL